MYAVFVAGRVSSDTQRQVIVAHYNGNNHVWYRTSNGGRGESNAWLSGNYNELLPELYFDLHVPLLNDVVGTKLTDVDTTAIENNEMPTVLIQKLSKQFRSSSQSLSSRTMRDVLNDVDKIIHQDPNLLIQYWSDKRRNGATTMATPAQPTATPATPATQSVIQVVRTNEQYSDNSLSFVPSLSNPELSGYVERVFSNGVSETQIYDYAIKNKLNVSIVGEAGTGKTTSTMAYASKRGLNYYCVSFNAGIESSQLFGKLMPTEDNKLVWQDGGFTECWRNGNAVIHLDELSFINAKQSGILFPALAHTRTLTLLDNKGEVIPMGENLLIVGSYNENYRGNNKLNQAFTDRFNIKLVFDYDTSIEKNFINSSTLLTLAEQMRADSIAGIYETPISTRLLKNFQQVAKEIGYEFAVDNFINNFTAEERGSVKLLLDAHRTNLELELTGKNA